MLPSLTLIILFQLSGAFIQQYFSLPIPSAVIGMILFFIYLCLTGGGNEKLMDTGSQLLKHLPLFFIPAGVGILVYTEELKTQGIAIMASLTIGTLIAFVFTLLLFKKLASSNKRQINDK
jgi:holin-like protein